MKRFAKVYLEITNRCNLACRFCPGTDRAPEQMDEARFSLLLERLRGWTDYLYFHLMGEPLCHPLLDRFLDLAGRAGFRVILTTNGVLLPRWKDRLLAAPSLHKINLSLHAYEANDLPMPLEEYLDGCLDYAAAADGNKLTVCRLWNGGGADARNGEILRALEERFPRPWTEEGRGVRVGRSTYLEYGEKFDWPDPGAQDLGQRVACRGLRDQIGVLCDGTAVPCCLDRNGTLALGNLLEQSVEEILAAPAARQIEEGFRRGVACRELCRRCDFARRRVGRNR